jgi:ferric-dicitrate binding protein FerR (iron transport regulator)
MDAFRDALTEFRGRTRAALLADEAAFQAAEEAHRSRRRWALLSLAVLLGAAALGALLVSAKKFGPMRP